MTWPRSIRAAAPTATAYLVIAALTLIWTRFEGGVAFIWISNALLTARLLTVRRSLWGLHLSMCGVASAIATSFLGFGPVAAVPMAVVNMFEVFLASEMLRRASVPEEPVESLRWFVGFLLGAGLIAPAVGALGGASVAEMIGGGSFSGNLWRWFCGHSLGALTFLPLLMLVYGAEVRASRVARSMVHTVEVLLLLSLVAVTSAAVFTQGDARLLFLPMLPIMLATFRAGRAVAAVSIVVLTVIGAVATLADLGPIPVAGGTVGDHLQFLQFYLAATVLAVLPIAAELTRRTELFRRLRDSEARYRLLADNSSDIILNLDAGGRIRFVSRSIEQLGGYAPDLLLGSNAADLVLAAHRPQVERAHLAALRGGGETTRVEYQARTQDGRLRWFETSSRSVLDASGSVDGVVSVIRDIEDRKVFEGLLSSEARTDPLTGLLNRRAFDGMLEATAAAFDDGEPAGCVALFDIDYFKRVNDTYGHVAGDRVIKAFADLALDSVRSGDVVARIGGEEFALLLIGATTEEAAVVCERLRASAAAYVLEDAGRSVRMTVSGGVARLLSGRQQQILREADAAMYEAKNLGRNRFAWAA
jgi:diguanylate cyclase (GGDEF)-like protein/PAS domain S-box-containing protein